MSCFPKKAVAEGLPRLKTEDGTNLVEFAIVFIVLSAILFGIGAFGTALYAYHFVSHASKSAARWAAVNGYTCQASPIGDNSCNGTPPMNCEPANAADLQSYVTGGGSCNLPGITPPGIDPNKVKVTASWPVQTGSPTICSTTQNSPGCTVEVTVCYDYKFLFPLMPSGSGKNCAGATVNGTLTLSSTSEMIIAH
jgi:Flp pilus assembly protein TadG